MTTTPTGENPTTLSDSENDNLKVINGIGSQTLPKLKEQGIRTLQDLAGISDDRIKTVAAEVSGVTEEMLKKWGVEAQDKLSSQQVAGSADTEASGNGNSPTVEGEWEFAGVFIVEFKVLKVEGQKKKEQIMVGRMEVNEGGTWLHLADKEPAIIEEGEELYEWMRRRLDERMPQVSGPEEKPSTKARPSAVLPVTVEIAQVKTFQSFQNETSIGIGKAGQPFSGYVRSGEPFALGASFELAGPGADDIVERQITYSAQFHVRNLTTKVKKYLGDTKLNPLIKGKLSYTGTLTGIILQPGLYRLQVVATLQDTPPVMGYLEVPMLQVV